MSQVKEVLELLNRYMISMIKNIMLKNNTKKILKKIINYTYKKRM